MVDGWAALRLVVVRRVDVARVGCRRRRTLHSALCTCTPLLCQRCTSIPPTNHKPFIRLRALAWLNRPSNFCSDAIIPDQARELLLSYPTFDADAPTPAGSGYCSRTQGWQFQGLDHGSRYQPVRYDVRYQPALSRCLLSLSRPDALGSGRAELSSIDAATPFAGHSSADRTPCLSGEDAQMHARRHEGSSTSPSLHAQPDWDGCSQECGETCTCRRHSSVVVAHARPPFGAPSPFSPVCLEPIPRG